MNRFLIPVALFAAAFSTVTGADVRTYDLILSDGTPIRTTIVWDDIQGLDGISGNFHYAAGDLSFRGKNSASGFIWMNDEHGTYYEFRKETTGSGFRWVGSADHGERMTLVPTGGKPAAPKPAAKGTVRHYHYFNEGSDRPFPVTIIWDDIEGLAGISGTITYHDGEQVSFTGRNPEDGYITFTASDGAIYSLWRRKRGDSFEWAGTGADAAAPFKVTFVPVEEAAGGAGAPKPAAVNGETPRQYTMTGPYGQQYPATIIWSNIKGLGPIKGSLFSPGENLTINGQNSRSGFIFFNDQYGTYYELTKQPPVGGKTHWKGTARFSDNTTRPISLLGN